MDHAGFLTSPHLIIRLSRISQETVKYLMESFPYDEDGWDIPLSPASSALDALVALDPPSPILTPSQLVFDLSLGDIPVVLYNGAYVSMDIEESTTEVADSDTGRDRRSLSNSTSDLNGTQTRRVGDDGAQSHSNHAVSRNQKRASIVRQLTIKPVPMCDPRVVTNDTSPSEAASSAASNGTFGPNTARPGFAPVPSDNTPRAARIRSSTLSGGMKNSEGFSESAKRLSTAEQRAISGSLAPSPLLSTVSQPVKTPAQATAEAWYSSSGTARSRSVSTPFASSPAGNSTATVETSSTLVESAFHLPAEDGQASKNTDTIPTRTLSRKPSRLSRDRKSRVQSRHIFTGYEAPSPSQSLPFREQHPDGDPHVAAALRALTTGDRPEVQLEDGDTSIESQESGYSARSMRHRNTEKEPIQNSPASHRSQRRPLQEGQHLHNTLKTTHPAPPELFVTPPASPLDIDDTAWLKTLTVQMLIDQEGFRSAEPSFKFSGIVRLRSSPDIPKPDLVMAQFRPLSRQAFHFHYAPWEGVPIIRRVTVNEDESKDYVSRQAHLTLKSNGVYVIRGQEAEHHHNHSYASNEEKLHWQFEYLVDDRRADAKDMEGEKIMTPLTFSCSPTLMLSSQAKRVNIIHIVKKSMAPKLVAEKLQPPGTTRPRTLSTSGTSPGTVGKNLSAKAPDLSNNKLKTQGWSLHRRTKSHHAPQNVDPRQSTTPSPLRNPAAAETQVNASPKIKARPQLRRRASSAGEHNLPTRALQRKTSRHLNTAAVDTANNSSEDPCTSAVYASPKLAPAPPTSRHIIHPGRISELLELEAKRSSGFKENWASNNTHTGSINYKNSVVDRSDRDSTAFVALSPRPRKAK